MGFSCSVPPSLGYLPPSTTDNVALRFDSSTGLAQASGVTIDDNNIVRAKRLQVTPSIAQTALQFMTDAATPLTRFLFIPTTAETGSGNTGYDFSIYRYDDAGAFAGIPMTITRSNGRTTLESLNAMQFGLNAVPVSRQSAITAPSGGATVDSQARTAINSIIDVLQAIGFIS